MKFPLIASIILPLASSLTFAASFDCTKASNFVEKSICNDQRLSKFDDALSQNYKAIFSSDIGDDARKELKASQRTWISTRNRCTNNDCLANIYQKRIDEICDYPVLSGMHPVCISSVESEPNTKQPIKIATDTDQPQSNSQHIQDAQLEKAWSCRPDIIDNFNNYVLKFSNDKCAPGGAFYPIAQTLEPMPEEAQRLAELLLTTYHVNLNDESTFNKFREESERWQRYFQKKAEFEQHLADEHARKLRSGELKISSMQDALTAYPDKDEMIKTAISPLLTPNQTPVTGIVVVDAMENPSVIRAKATTAMAIYVGQGGKENAYIYLTLTKQTKNFRPDKLRIGGAAEVIGKYTRNIKYQTNSGEEKIAPVFEVMYINAL